MGNTGVSVGSVLQEAKCYMGLKEQNINTLTPRHSQQVGQLLRQLQGSDGARLGSLQGTPLNTAGLDYVGLLREIADEQSFEVTYVPIDELSTDGGWTPFFRRRGVLLAGFQGAYGRVCVVCVAPYDGL